jgi:hypothetical protein
VVDFLLLEEVGDEESTPSLPPSETAMALRLAGEGDVGRGEAGDGTAVTEGVLEMRGLLRGPVTGASALNLKLSSLRRP